MRFIRENTAPAVPPLVPEITLYLACEITPLWQASEETLDRTGLPPPYWAFAWAGGQALARHVLDHPDIVRGRRVLDFAAGSGVVGIACARAGAAHVEAAEIDPFARAAIRLNAALNQVEVTPLAEDAAGRTDGGWDVVLAGDVCYERPMAERVTIWLNALAAGGTRVLLADPGRAYLPKTGLTPLARYSVPVSRELEDRDVRETVVYRLGG